MGNFEAMLEFEAKISDGAWKFLKEKYAFEDDTLRETLDEMDPTGKYKEWLARWIAAEIKSPGTGGITKEDDQIKQHLEDFTKIKMLKNFEDSKDIGSYTPQALYNLIEDYKEERSLSESQAKILAEGTTEVFREGPVVVVTPTSFAASQILSDPSGWCTRSEYNYRQYSQQGPLYVFLLRGKPVLQIHNPTSQMMARGNARIYESFGSNIILKPIAIFPQKYVELCWNGIKQVTSFAKLIEVGDDIDLSKLTLNDVSKLLDIGINSGKRWSSVEEALAKLPWDPRTGTDSSKNIARIVSGYDNKFHTKLLVGLKASAKSAYTDRPPTDMPSFQTAMGILTRDVEIETQFLAALPRLIAPSYGSRNSVMGLVNLDSMLKTCLVEYVPSDLAAYKGKLVETIKVIWDDYLKVALTQMDKWDKKNGRDIHYVGNILTKLDTPEWGVIGYLNKMRNVDNILKFVKIIKPNERYAPAESRMIAVDILASINYCEEIVKARWPELEAKILTSRTVDLYYEYIDKVIQDVWPQAEAKLVKYSDPLKDGGTHCFSRLVDYAIKYKKARWVPLEKLFLAEPLNKRLAPFVARYVVLVKAPWPEIEPIIQDDPVSYKEYQKLCLGAERNPGLETSLLNKKDVKLIVEYVADFIKGPWPEAEDIIRRGVSAEIIKYCKVRGRWPLAERTILTRSQDSIVSYAQAIIAPERWREAEPKILRGNINTIFAYLDSNVRERWPEIEEIVFNSTQQNIAEYAAKYIEGPWPEAEEHMILTDNWIAMLNYAIDVKKQRWPEAEAALPKSLDYDKCTKSYPTPGGGSQNKFTPYGGAIIRYIKVFFNGKLDDWPELTAKIPNWGLRRFEDYLTVNNYLTMPISRISAVSSIWHRIFSS